MWGKLTKLLTIQISKRMDTSFSIIREISLINVENILLVTSFGLFENALLSQMFMLNISSNKILVREESEVFKDINQNLLLYSVMTFLMSSPLTLTVHEEDESQSFRVEVQSQRLIQFSW